MNRIASCVAVAACLLATAPMAGAASFSLSNSIEVSAQNGVLQPEGGSFPSFFYNASYVAPTVVSTGVTLQSQAQPVPGFFESEIDPVSGVEYFSTSAGAGATFSGETTAPNQQAEVTLESTGVFVLPAVSGDDAFPFDAGFSLAFEGTVTAGAGEVAYLTPPSITVMIYEGVGAARSIPGIELPGISIQGPQGVSYAANSSVFTLDVFATELASFDYSGGLTLEFLVRQGAVIASVVPEPASLGLLLGSMGLVQVFGRSRVPAKR